MINRIRERRKALGLSQIQLAALVGIKQGAISNVETGNWKPGVRLKRELARVLNTREEELFPNSQALAILRRLLSKNSEAKP